MDAEPFDTVVIGAGQAGLSVGYHLREGGRSFVIVDAHERIGDNWRERYDSLRLFTPPAAVGLDGFAYPGPRSTMPSRDQMAEYLEMYVKTLRLPVRLGVRVTGVSERDGLYLVTTDRGNLVADNVVVATGAHREPRVPAFARDLDPSIVQMHSIEYRNPTQLPDGPVLVVGAGNSGADISLELARTRSTVLSGPINGHIPVDIDGWVSRHIAFKIVRFLGVHVLTLRTPIGRRARAKMAAKGDPLVRVKPKQLEAAGVRRVGKTVGAGQGRPVTEDGVRLDVTSVIWAIGFRHDLSWIDLPIFGEDGRPVHTRGVVPDAPGLYFVGLPFQFSAASDVLPGVGRDARYVVKHLLRRGAPANVEGLATVR
jgi:putative flavoprotein involved in K+ transport